MRGRNNQMARIIRVITWIESSRLGLSVRDIHDRLNESGEKVSIRTIYRDLEAINLAGLPVLEEPNIEFPKESRWRIEKGKGIRSLSGYSERELLTLYFSVNGIVPMLDYLVRGNLLQSLRLIEESMVESEWEYYRTLSRIITIGQNPLPVRGIKWDHLENTIAAAIDGKPISYRFRDKSLNEWKSIVPAEIHFENGMVAIHSMADKSAKIDLASMEDIRSN